MMYVKGEVKANWAFAEKQFERAGVADRVDVRVGAGLDLLPGLVEELGPGSADVVFLDVRTDGEWDGSNDRGNKRAGHVPGAVHLEWLNFITGDRSRMFKSAEELRSMLESAGVTPEKEVVTY